MNAQEFFSSYDLHIIEGVFLAAGGHGCVYSLVCKSWLEITKSLKLWRNFDTLLIHGEVNLYNKIFDSLPPIWKTYLLHPNFFYFYNLVDNDRFLNCVQYDDIDRVKWILEKRVIFSNVTSMEAMLFAVRNRSLEMIDLLNMLPIENHIPIVEESLKTDDIDIIRRIIYSKLKTFHNVKHLMVKYLSYKNLAIMTNSVRYDFFDEKSIVEAIKRRDTNIMRYVYNRTNDFLSTKLADRLIKDGYDLGIFSSIQMET